MNMRTYLNITLLSVGIACLLGFAANVYPGSTSNQSKPVAEAIIHSSGINWLPQINYDRLTLTVSKPDKTVFQKIFVPGSSPYIDLYEITGNSSTCDGSYTYELTVTPVGSLKKTTPQRDESFSYQWNYPQSLTQTGYFSVKNGSIITANGIEAPMRPMDVVHNDDAIITGSLCIGYDCLTDGTESFGSDSLKIKENNIRLFFDDTSSVAGYPANDWRILANDEASGGGNYFAIQDVTEGSVPFKIEAGAKSNSLYVDDAGRIGLGTSTPIYNIDIKYGDSPAVRFYQDSSYGWTEQKWDLSGNESNFFLRDGTNGSKLPIRVQPNTPTNTLTLKAAVDSDPFRVGIGTWSPGYPMELETTGANAAFVCDRTDGAKNFISATASYGQFGTVSNHPTRVLVNSAWKLQLNSDNSLSMASGATCTAGGTWTNSSSRDLKENIQSLGADEALNTLSNLNPVKFNYKVDKAEKHVGFIAEDVPDLLASADRKGLSPMDVTAVLTKVLQEELKVLREQQKSLQEQQKCIREQQKTIEELKEKIKTLEKK